MLLIAPMDLPDSSPVTEAAANLETLVQEHITARAKENTKNAFLVGTAGAGVAFLTAVPLLGLLLAPPFLANGYRAVKYASNIRTPISRIVQDGFVDVAQDGVYCQLNSSSRPAAGLLYLEENLQKKPEAYLQHQAAHQQVALDLLQQRQSQISTLLHNARLQKHAWDERAAQYAERGPLEKFFNTLWETVTALPSLYFKGCFPQMLPKEEVEELALAEAWYTLLQTTLAYGQEFFVRTEKAYDLSFSPDMRASLTVCQNRSQQLAQSGDRLLKTMQSLRKTEEERYLIILKLS